MLKLMFYRIIYYLTMEDLDFYETLLNRLNGAKKVVFMGIGEEKLRDDGVGPYIISKLLSCSDKRVIFINAGIDPMARIDEVINFEPSHLILLDTCTLNKPPGTVAILERENICDYVPISTHTIPVHIVIDLIVEKLPDLNVFMIGFVPKSFEGFTELKLYKQDELSLDDRSNNIDLPFFEPQLTKTIEKEADKLIEIIKKLIKAF